MIKCRPIQRDGIFSILNIYGHIYRMKSERINISGIRQLSESVVFLKNVQSIVLTLLLQETLQ